MEDHSEVLETANRSTTTNGYGMDIYIYAFPPNLPQEEKDSLDTTAKSYASGV